MSFPLYLGVFISFYLVKEYFIGIFWDSTASQTLGSYARVRRAKSVKNIRFIISHLNFQTGKNEEVSNKISSQNREIYLRST